MINYKEEISKDILNSHNVKDEYKDLTVKERRNIQQKESKPFAVGLWNVTGELNCGIIIRTAALFGAENIFVFGRKEIDNRSLVGAHNYINISSIKCDLKTEINKIIDFLYICRYIPIFVEQHEESVLIQEFNWNIYTLFKPCIMLGNEGRGISKEIIDQFPYGGIVEIPQVGVMRSHNVSVSAGIVMYDLCNKKGWL